MASTLEKEGPFARHRSYHKKSRPLSAVPRPLIPLPAVAMRPWDVPRPLMPLPAVVMRCIVLIKPLPAFLLPADPLPAVLLQAALISSPLPAAPISLRLDAEDAETAVVAAGASGHGRPARAGAGVLGATCGWKHGYNTYV